MASGDGGRGEQDCVFERVLPAFRAAKGSIIKTIATAAKPTSISLAGGIPLDSTFPFAGVQVDLAEGGPPLVLKNRAVSGGTTEHDGHSNLHLNYTTGFGDPDLRRLLTQHMKDYHAPKYDGWSVLATTGSTDAITKCFQLLKPQSGRAIVVAEALVWPAVLAVAEPLGYEVRGVRLDPDGICIDALEQTLEELKAAGERAAFLYTTPHGQNPTGSSLSLERKQQLYAACQKHDLIIVEDDPYRLLCLPEDINEVREEQMPGIEDLPPSLLSLDTDGRVIHLESLSKWICPGLRLGWVTGPKRFIEGPYRMWTELTVQFACTISQATFRDLLLRWGHAGLHNHLKSLQAHYARQRCAMQESAMRHLQGLAEWTPPKAGMFVWFKVNHLAGKGKAETEALFQELIIEDVLLVPGYAFEATGPKQEPAFRATYATASPQRIEEGIARFARVLRGHASADA